MLRSCAKLENSLWLVCDIVTTMSLGKAKKPEDTFPKIEAWEEELEELEKIKGRDPKIAILNQDNAVKRNACCKFNFLS